MSHRSQWVLGFGIVVALLAVGTIPTRGAETVKRYPADKGPSTIDVSKYPKEMQDIYRNLFVKKCGKCHTPARAINTDFAPSKWETYVKKMILKKKAETTGEQGKSIYRFLVFDTKERKPGFWNKLPAEEKRRGE